VCSSWIQLGSLRQNLLAQNIQQTYNMDVLNGETTCFSAAFPMLLHPATP
jgi:hypothetical protein